MGVRGRKKISKRAEGRQLACGAKNSKNSKNSKKNVGLDKVVWMDAGSPVRCGCGDLKIILRTVLGHVFRTPHSYSDSHREETK